VGKQNKVLLLLAAIGLALVGTLYAASGWITNVHMEQGGDQLTVESGGIVEFKSGGLQKLSSQTLEITDSDTDLTLTAAYSGKITTNYGAAGNRTFTLPTAAAGIVIDVLHTDTDNLKVVKSGSDTILGTTNNSLVISAGTLGGSLQLVSPRALQWVIVGREGTWTDTTVLP